MFDKYLFRYVTIHFSMNVGAVNINWKSEPDHKVPGTRDLNLMGYKHPAALLIFRVK